MLSFHNDPKIKEMYLKRLEIHEKLDTIIQGTGWVNGKGCAVGCTLESYDHSKYPEELGLPEWLAYLEDIIFENLPNDEAKKWPRIFLGSIPVGVNLENVRHKLAIIRMDNLLEIQNKLLESNTNINLKKIFLDVINAINIIKKCHESELNKDHCDWSEAESAAWSAQSEAESAAWSAAESAAQSVAGSAARSAESAARAAAKSAARSAESAARSVAGSAARSTGSAESAKSAAWSAGLAESAARYAWKKESENLIKLLKQCE